MRVSLAAGPRAKEKPTMNARRFLLFAALGAFACGGNDAPPTAVATPPPPPEPSPSPVATFTCPLPALPDLHNTCPKLDPQLWEVVENAIQTTLRERPELFDFNDELGGGSYKVLNRDEYINTTVENIHKQGVCSRAETEEIQVKTTNDFNEQYNIWTSGGYVRRSYITTCIPAQF
jgi:hypothetical protein